MSTKAHYFRVGLFVIIGIVLIVSGIIIFGTLELLPTPMYKMETYLEQSVQGLEVGSRVKLRGVVVGNVDEIAFAQTVYHLEGEDVFKYGRLVVVRMSVDPALLGEEYDEDRVQEAAQKNIDRGMRLKLASQGVTGVKFIEADYIEPDSHTPFDPPWTPRDIYIPSAPGVFTEIVDSIAELTDKLGNIDISEMTADLKDLVDTLARNIEDAQIGEMSHKVQVVLDDVHDLLTGSDLDQMMANLRDTTEKVKELMTEIQESEEIKRTMTNLAETTDKVNQATERLPQMMADLERSIRRLNMLQASEHEDLEKAVYEVRLTVENLREFTDLARRYPSALLFSEEPPPSKAGEKK